MTAPTGPRRRARREAQRAAARTAKIPAERGSASAPRTAVPGELPGSSIEPTRRAAAGVGALVFLVLASYFPALSGGFVWDDVIFSEEPVIHRWSGLWNIWFSPADMRKEGHYWPIVYTTFWLEHKLWGLAPFGYHLVNLVLHLVNALLVWRIGRRLAVPGAWALAAVFAVHPLHVESVAWVIERKDLLSALFYLSAVLAWMRFTESPRPARYALVLGLFTAALLSKSVAVTLPAALVIWHWWKRGTVTVTDWLRLAPLFACGLAITAADLAFYTSREPLSLGYSAVERVLIASRALWFYVGKLLWPTDLAVIYPLWEVRAGDGLGWVYVAAAAAVAAALWLTRHRIGRGPAAGAAFFAVTLSPMLGFVDYGYMQFSLVADRFQYLAGIGVMAVLVAGAVRGAHRLPAPLRYAGAGALVLVLAVLGASTWRQAGVYRDDITLFSHIVALNPQARSAHLNLGSALLDARRIEEGYAASLVALAQRPDDSRVHSNLGRALLLMERIDEASEHLTRALELDSRSAIARQNMAELLRKQGRYEEAAASYREALARDASYALAHAGLGISLYELERYEEALASMDHALALSPDSPRMGTLHVLTGRALQAMGRFDAAERRFRRAAGLDPDNAAPLVDLSRLRIAQRRFDEAGQFLRRAFELASDDVVALHNVAEAHRKQGRYKEAIESYRAVLAIDPDFAMAHAGMGDAQFRLERYAEAIESLERSVSLHPIPPTATTRLLLMGTAARALGRSEAGTRYFERAVEIEPDNAEALDHLAMARFEQQRYEEALGLYRTMLEIRPDSAQTHANLGATLYYLDRLEEALRSFEEALMLEPELDTDRASIEDLRRTLRERGQ